MWLSFDVGAVPLPLRSHRLGLPSASTSWRFKGLFQGLEQYSTDLYDRS